MRINILVMSLVGVVWAGCSSDATPSTGGSGGSANTGGSGTGGNGTGGSTAAGTGGKAAGGNVGTGGGPASTCAINSGACQTCIGSSCKTQVDACTADTKCQGPIGAVTGCICTAQNQMSTSGSDTCTTTFNTDGGQPAKDVSTCVLASCKTQCGL
jgi:hypothetical protein